ncbi:Kinesin-like protein kif27 [Lobulomyces angularis]|nr:Kinesin-like protein kif27 [Lobulomyces angularis]
MSLFRKLSKSFNIKIKPLSLNLENSNSNQINKNETAKEEVDIKKATSLEFVLHVSQANNVIESRSKVNDVEQSSLIQVNSHEQLLNFSETPYLLSSSEEVEDPVDASAGELHIDQLTTFAAFGVNLPSLMNQKTGERRASSSSAFALPTSPVVVSNPQCRRHSMVEKTNSNKLSTSIKVGVELPSIKTKPSLNSDTFLVNINSSSKRYSSSTISQPRKSILKNRPGSYEKSTVIDQDILVDYGGDVKEHLITNSKNKHSIMSTLAGASLKENEVLDDDIKKSLALEMPFFEESLKKCMTLAIYLSGEMIIHKHDIGYEMYFLSKGKVEILSSDGQTQYGIINAGSFFGEMGVLFDIPRTASVRALETCYCMVLTREKLTSVISRFPTLETRFRAVVSARMYEVQGKRARSKRVQINLPSKS